MKSVLVLRIASVVPALVLVSCGSPGPKARTESPESAIPVRVAEPGRVERRAFITASGTVEAQDAVEAAFQVSGKVARVFVEEGQAVGRGQPLAELDSADYRRGLEAAEAQAAMARANLDKARNGVRREELEQACAAFERADDEYARYKQLYERKSMAPVDFAKVEAAWRAARAQYEMAQNGARAEDRAAAQAALRQAEAQAGVSRKRVAETRLLSPLAGIVARRAIDPGETAGAGVPVFTVMDLNPVLVRVGLPESDVGRVRPGQRATITVPAMPGHAFPGTVQLVGVAADPASRTFTAKIAAPNAGLALRAGMVAEARIEGSETISALTAPGSAVMRDPQGATFVWVYYPDRGRVYARRVEAGGVEGREVEIRAGLRGGEWIVVAGQHKVREGARVEVVR